MRTAFTVVGFVVTMVVSSVVVIKIMAKYGHYVVSGCKVANVAISKGIRRLA